MHPLTYDLNEKKVAHIEKSIWIDLKVLESIEVRPTLSQDYWILFINNEMIQAYQSPENAYELMNDIVMAKNEGAEEYDL